MRRLASAVGGGAGAFTLRFSASHGAALILLLIAGSAYGPTAGAAITAARSIPALAIPWLAGWWYDRFSPKALLAAVGLIEVAAVCGALLATPTALWAIIALSSILGATLSVFDTTLTAGLKDSGLTALRSSVTTGIAFDIGKLAAAGLAWWHSTSATTAVACMVALELCGVAVLVLKSASVGLGANQTQKPWGKWMLPMLPALPAIVVLNSSVGCLLFWQVTVSQASPSAFALVNAFLAIGAIAGNLILGRAGQGRLSMRVGILLSSASLLTAAWAGPNHLAVLSAGAAGWGLGVAWWHQAMRAWVIGSAPEGYRGRAGSVLVATTRASLIAGAALFALVSYTWGVLPAAAIAAVAGTLAALTLPLKVHWPTACEEPHETT